MSENTTTTEKPKPQKVKWKNIAYYHTYEEADTHRNGLDESVKVKVRRCGPEGTRFVVKIGTLIKGGVND